MIITMERDKTIDRLAVLRSTLTNPLPFVEGIPSSFFADYFGSIERLVLRAIADSDAADA